MAGPWSDESVLKEDVHAALVADLDRFAKLAGVRSEYVWRPLSASVGANECGWVSGFRGHAENGSWGILYSGEVSGVGDRMQAIAGALVRNFVDARVRTVTEAIHTKCTALLIPDFCVGTNSQPDWLKNGIVSLLLARRAAGQQTVLYATSLPDVERVYGRVARDVLHSDYRSDPRHA